MKPVEDLKAEHEGILVILAVLEKMSEKIVSGESVPVDHLKQAIEFLRVFADKCHHGKEEGILFPAMREAGVIEEGGPLGVMLSEHDRGRELIAQMKALLESYEEGTPDSLMVLTTPAFQYVNLLRSHIWKENNVLFPMAEQTIPKEKLEALGKRFDSFENEVIGQGTHEVFHELIGILSEIYLQHGTP